MLTFLIALSFCGVRNVISASDVGVVQPAQTTTTATLDHEKRAGSVATITGGQASSWLPSAASNAPKPTGSSFSLVASDPDKGGFDVYLGDDLRNSMDKVIAEKCGDATSTDCHNQLLALIKKDQVDLQKRQFGLIAAFAVLIRPIIVGAVLGIVTGIMIGPSNKKTPSNLHAPKENVAPALASTTASAVAIATATNDPKPIVVAVPDDEKPDPVPLIKLESNGDMTINLEQDLAKRLDDLIAMNSANCPQPRKRDLHSLQKRVDITPELAACLTAGMVIVIRNIYNGALGQLARLRQEGRVAARPPQAGALVAMAEAGRQVAQYQDPLGLNDEDWRALQVGVYWEVYNREVARQHDGQVVRVQEQDRDNSEQKFCPPKELLRCSADACKGKDGKCADDALWFKNCDCEDDNTGCPKVEDMPLCDNCGGDKGGQQCKGLNEGGYKDCICVSTKKRVKGLKYFNSIQEMDQTQKAFEGLPDLPDNPNNNNPHCELRKRDIVNVETNLFKSLVKHAVCKDFPLDINKGFDKTFTKDDASKDDGNWDGYKDWKFQFKFEDRPPTCLDTCETIYDSFISTPCSGGPHSMYPKGEIILACGTASYQITPPSSSPPSQPQPPQGCPDPYPDIFNGGMPAFEKWFGDPKNKCDRCPDGKFDFCAIGGSTCQCTAKECVDKKQYMCYK